MNPPMQGCLSLVVAALVSGQTSLSSYQTANFVTQAADAEVARLVAESAESCRKELARLWLERDLPDWPSPCQVYVSIDLGRTAGRTDIAFSKGRVLTQRVEVQGPLERVLKGALPHELTHVLFAHYFGVQPPRWADEGGAILSEDGVQAERQRQLLRKIMADDRCFSLRRLLGMRQYPEDPTCLYAQGHSVSHFLVTAKSRKTFLSFVSEGLARGWDEATRDQYGYQNVEELEKAWLGWASKQPEGGKAGGVRMGAVGRASVVSLLSPYSNPLLGLARKAEIVPSAKH
jgi:hypothetical protein